MAHTGLSSIPRHELVAAALSLGIANPESMTSDELTHSIQLASESGGVPPQSNNGWFEVARHLVASVMGQGLNMPQAARFILGPRPTPKQRAPLPTVTLAQIYIAQGHLQRARMTLSLVLSREPQNTKARRLLESIGATETPGTGAEPRPGSGSSGSGPSGAGSPETDAAGAQGITVPAGFSVAAAEGSAPPSEVSPFADALVVIRQSERVYLCWDLSAPTARRLERGESLCLLLSLVKPDWSGAKVETREVSLAEPSGTHEFPCSSGVVLRAALALSAGGQRKVLAVASTCSVVGTELSLQFVPRQGNDDSALAERAWAKLQRP